MAQSGIVYCIVWGIPKLYVRGSGWWKKDEPCWALLVSTISLCSYASRVLIKEFLGSKLLCRAALTDHCVMVFMLFIQRVHTEDDTIKLNIPGFDL